MIPFIDRSSEVTLTCPACQEKFLETIGALEAKDISNCPKCGEGLDVRGFREAIKQAETKPPSQ